MDTALSKPRQANPVELAILTKWLLHEAWTCTMQVLQKQLAQKLIALQRKNRLELLYTEFYNQAYYASVHTHADIDRLLNNTKKMLLFLRELDEKAWTAFMVQYELM